jgi:hypothetical protein
MPLSYAGSAFASASVACASISAQVAAFSRYSSALAFIAAGFPFGTAEEIVTGDHRRQ